MFAEVSTRCFKRKVREPVNTFKKSQMQKVRQKSDISERRSKGSGGFPYFVCITATRSLCDL